MNSRPGRWMALLCAVAAVAGCSGSLSAAEAPAPIDSPSVSARSGVPAAAARAASRAPSAPVTSPTATPTASPTATPRPAATALPDDSGTGRRIVYAIDAQRVWLVDAAGDVESTYLVSGRPSQPDPGRYRVFSRSRHAASAVSDATMQYMVRFTHGKRTGAAIGFHDIPRRSDGSYEQSEAELGKPLSAGCVRQSRADAQRLWEFAPVGTSVIVVA